jgi:hypothetical protein
MASKNTSLLGRLFYKMTVFFELFEGTQPTPLPFGSCDKQDVICQITKPLAKKSKYSSRACDSAYGGRTQSLFKILFEIFVQAR